MENKTEQGGLQSTSALEPRENMVETAVKFLQNAKVRGSPFEQKKAFLKRKGLTDEEIALAVERSGTVIDDTVKYTSPVNENTQIATSTYAHHPPVPVVSTWQKARDFTSMVIVIGGISYAVYIIYKKYVAPYFFGPSEEERQLEQLNQSINELKESLANMVRTLEENSRVMTKQQENIQQLLNNPVKSTTDLVNMQNTQSTNEIKEEIRSLKGLLLSRRQFPPAPVNSPVLPSWQLTSNSASGSAEGNGHQASGDGENKSMPSTDAEVNKYELNQENLINSEEDNHSQPILKKQVDSEEVTDVTGHSGAVMQSEDPEQIQHESNKTDQCEVTDKLQRTADSVKDTVQTDSQISDQT